MRVLLFTLVGLAVGCGAASKGTAPSGSGGTEPVKPRTLTEDEKVAWAKLRRDCPDKDLRVMAWFPADDAWKTHQGNWIAGIGVGYDSHDIGPTAEWAAKLSAVKAVAVVDLFSKDRPFVVRWVQDDGSGPKSQDKPPSPELAASLDAYLVEVMASASR